MAASSALVYDDDNQHSQDALPSDGEGEGDRAQNEAVDDAALLVTTYYYYDV